MLCWPRARRPRFMRVLPKIHLAVPMLAAAALLAGCGGGGGGGGGGSSKLDSTDVAVVGDSHVTKATFDDTMHQQQLSIEAQGQKFPTAGSTQYAAIKNQVVAALVQNAEFELQAK